MGLKFWYFGTQIFGVWGQKVGWEIGSGGYRKRWFWTKVTFWGFRGAKKVEKTDKSEQKVEFCPSRRVGF